MEVKNYRGKRAFDLRLRGDSGARSCFLLDFRRYGCRQRHQQVLAVSSGNFYQHLRGIDPANDGLFRLRLDFHNLFRGEVVDKVFITFLSSLRREVLVAGKYFSGLVTSVILFSLTTAGSLFFLYWARDYPANVSYLFDGPGLRQCLIYLGVTILGCIGYGAVFMFIGLFFRNPIIPALVVYFWEWLNFLLPPVLKKISIIHYLHTLAPVPINEGPMATVVAATSPWLAVPSLLIFTAIVLLWLR